MGAEPKNPRIREDGLPSEATKNPVPATPVPGLCDPWPAEGGGSGWMTVGSVSDWDGGDGEMRGSSTGQNSGSDDGCVAIWAAGGAVEAACRAGAVAVIGCGAASRHEK